jgi:hypothetical protein
LHITEQRPERARIISKQNVKTLMVQEVAVVANGILVKKGLEILIVEVLPIGYFCMFSIGS